MVKIIKDSFSDAFRATMFFIFILELLCIFIYLYGHNSISDLYKIMYQTWHYQGYQC